MMLFVRQGIVRTLLLSALLASACVSPPQAAPQPFAAGAPTASPNPPTPSPSVSVDPRVEVPLLFLDSLREAKRILSDLGLKARIKHRNDEILDAGLVLDQTPTGGRVMPGTVVTIWVAKKPKCSASYPDVCIPPPPPYLNCPGGDGSPPYTTHRNFRVLQPDPHGFDGNNDGWGCTS
jgi:hypothetical protein